MRRITSAVLLVLVSFGAFAAADALGPESVPMPDTVELHGEVPESGPPPSGFFIVPPRVIDMRVDETPARPEGDETEDDSDDSDDIEERAHETPGPDDADEPDESTDDADDSDPADDDESDDDGSDDDGNDGDD